MSALAALFMNRRDKTMSESERANYKSMSVEQLQARRELLPEVSWLNEDQKALHRSFIDMEISIRGRT